MSFQQSNPAGDSQGPFENISVFSQTHSDVHDEDKQQTDKSVFTNDEDTALGETDELVTSKMLENAGVGAFISEDVDNSGDNTSGDHVLSNGTGHSDNTQKSAGNSENSHNWQAEGSVQQAKPPIESIALDRSSTNFVQSVFPLSMASSHSRLWFINVHFSFFFSLSFLSLSLLLFSFSFYLILFYHC